MREPREREPKKMKEQLPRGDTYHLLYERLSVSRLPDTDILQHHQKTQQHNQQHPLSYIYQSNQQQKIHTENTLGKYNMKDCRKRQSIIHPPPLPTRRMWWRSFVSFVVVVVVVVPPSTVVTRVQGQTYEYEDPDDRYYHSRQEYANNFGGPATDAAGGDDGDPYYTGGDDRLYHDYAARHQDNLAGAGGGGLGYVTAGDFVVVRQTTQTTRIENSLIPFFPPNSFSFFLFLLTLFSNHFMTLSVPLVLGNSL
jgi:hypothetical protein